MYGYGINQNWTITTPANYSLTSQTTNNPTLARQWFTFLPSQVFLIKI